jgi:hypothetical protein
VTEPAPRTGELVAAVEELLAALPYGGHMPDCNASYGPMWRCRCDLGPAATRVRKALHTPSKDTP